MSTFKPTPHSVLHLGKRTVLVFVVFLGGLITSVTILTARADPEAEDTVIRLAVNHIDSQLGAVAASAEALGKAYLGLIGTQGTISRAQALAWRKQTVTKGSATLIKTWPDTLQDGPAFQAEYPSYLSYNDPDLSNSTLRNFAVFDKLTVAFRTAYESLPFSWVYFTSAEHAFMIYPFVPLANAENNGTPTNTTFYQAADFENKRSGWTEPYLDLVGAGMMVTVSYPVFQGELLLGVMSRDVTLEQATKSVLADLGINGYIALLVNAQGLAIDSSDPALAAEIADINSMAKAAVLYYRTADGLADLKQQDAVASQSTSINDIVETALANANGGVSVHTIQARKVSVGQVPTTGWYLLMIGPKS
ncbi:MAG: hypothetical protein AAF699_17500 [Pseudomonadota bacterium]